MNKHHLKKIRIFIAGHRGMVGSALVRHFKKNNIDNLILATKKKLDLLNEQKVIKFIKKERPHVIINCAGKVGGILANSSYPVEFLNENITIQLNLINAAFTNKIVTSDTPIIKAFSSSFQAVFKSPNLWSYIGMTILASLIFGIATICGCGISSIVTVPMIGIYSQHLAYNKGILN